jgi:hypothetical protein
LWQGDHFRGGGRPAVQTIWRTFRQTHLGILAFILAGCALLALAAVDSIPPLIGSVLKPECVAEKTHCALVEDEGHRKSLTMNRTRLRTEKVITHEY